MTPQLRSGYIEDTLLDPHAANNSVPGQFSVSGGLIGAVAKGLIHRYQAQAHDPPVFIPPGVDAAQVFYQHTKASHDHGVNQGLYNLWGQVPVPNLSGNPIAYYNLTGAGATHSGNYGVAHLVSQLRRAHAGQPGATPPDAPARGADRPGDDPGCQFPRGESRRGCKPGTRCESPRTLSRNSLARPRPIQPSGFTWDRRRTHRSYPLPARREPRDRRVDVHTELSQKRTLPGDRHGIPARLATRPGLTVVPMTPLGRFTVEGVPNR